MMGPLRALALAFNISVALALAASPAKAVLIFTDRTAWEMAVEMTVEGEILMEDFEVVVPTRGGGGEPSVGFNVVGSFALLDVQRLRRTTGIRTLDPGLVDGTQELVITLGFGAAGLSFSSPVTAWGDQSPNFFVRSAIFIYVTIGRR